MRKTLVLLLLAAVPVTGWLLGNARAHGSHGHTNLKVLPKDIASDDLKAIMKEQAKALGVKCEHCHNKDDYASDEKEAKVTARKMMRMVNAINQSHIKAKDAQKVVCWTCHRGEQTPPKQP